MLAYNKNLTACYAAGEDVVGSLINITMERAKSVYTDIHFKSTNIRGNLTEVETYVRRLELENCPLIEGNIESLRCKDVTSINFNSCVNIYGTIEGFASQLITLGRTSGSVKFWGYNSGITYNGELLESKLYTLTISENSYTFE